MMQPLVLVRGNPLLSEIIVCFLTRKEDFGSDNDVTLGFCLVRNIINVRLCRSPLLDSYI